MGNLLTILLLFASTSQEIEPLSFHQQLIWWNECKQVAREHYESTKNVEESKKVFLECFKVYRKT